MRHLLAIDIGNTNITAGVFVPKGKNPIKKAKFATSKPLFYKRNILGLREAHKVARCDIGTIIISSVVPNALLKLKKVLSEMTDAPILILGENANVPIKNLYRIKSEVGQDRLVNAFAAKTLYGMPCVIIDFGTAITFDIVSKKGEYLGGLILPGIEMGLASLYEKTSLLPKVRLRPEESIIGKTTVNSMRGGILFGYGAMCDGLVSKFKKILGTMLNVIATGGNARLIKRYAKSIQIVDENLALKGLNLISKIF